MISTPPKILSHVSALKKGNLVTPEYILSGDSSKVQLLNRFCPHRMYPISDVGNSIDIVKCRFHGFEWDKNGEPVNNDRKIKCGSAGLGKSGLVFKDFLEPNASWVEDLAAETNLEYSHSLAGTSNGSWLWMMDIQADLLHIRKGEDSIHPGLSEVTDLDDVVMSEGEGWVLQTSSTGWWLFVYPYTFVEWTPGCLAINYTVPKDPNNEFGFEWITQFYYTPSVSIEKRKEFESLEEVFKEDVAAVEMQKGKWFPIMKPYNRLENHCVHFGEWVSRNRKE